MSIIMSKKDCNGQPADMVHKRDRCRNCGKRIYVFGQGIWEHVESGEIFCKGADGLIYDAQPAEQAATIKNERDVPRMQHRMCANCGAQIFGHDDQWLHTNWMIKCGQGQKAYPMPEGVARIIGERP